MCDTNNRLMRMQQINAAVTVTDEAKFARINSQALGARMRNYLQTEPLYSNRRRNVALHCVCLWSIKIKCSRLSIVKTNSFYFERAALPPKISSLT